MSIAYPATFPATSPTLAGGTTTLAINNTVNRVASSEIDKSGLGRWSSILIKGKGQVSIRMISAYRCVRNTKGPLSVWNQQRFLLDQSNCFDDPFLKFNNDLISSALATWQAAGKQLVLGIDLNEDVRTSSFTADLRSKLGLVEIMMTSFSSTPPTYARGSQTIDGLYISPSLQCQTCAFTDIVGDHRVLWADIPLTYALGFVPSQDMQLCPMRLKLQDPRVVARYHELLTKFYYKHDLPRRVSNLRDKFSEPVHKHLLEEYNQLDSLRTQAILFANKHCRRLHMGAVPYSPLVATAGKKIRAWSLVVKKKSGGSVDSKYLKRKLHEAGITGSTELSLGEAKSELQQAWRCYNIFKKRASQERSTWLEELALARSSSGNNSSKQEMENLIRRERQRRDARLIRRIQQVERRGLSSIEILANDGWKEITNKDEIEQALCAELSARFNQARNTPFLHPSILEDIGPWASKEGTASILEGKYLPPDDCDPWLKELLPHLQYAFPEQNFPLSWSELDHQQGWKRIKEKTSAGRSGITIPHMKANLQDPLICQVDTIMAYLPFCFGFSPSRWQQGVGGAWKEIFRRKDIHKPTHQNNNVPKTMQLKLSYQNENMQEVYGDDIEDDNYETQEENIIFHNINGIKNEDNWSQILQTMKEKRVSIFGLAELNCSMNGTRGYRWTNAIRKWFYYNRFSSSESTVNFESNFKPGGTITTIINKWQARVIEKGCDKILGRWSYLVIATNRRKLTVITAYRPCKTMGPSTAWTQQWSLLKEQGHALPDPIKTFYIDLDSFVKQQRDKGHEIILMMDANEPISAKPTALTNILRANGLSDVISWRHGSENIPNTHARGSKRIDYIFGTERVCQNITASGILPLGMGYQSDHRAIFCRVNFTKLFESEIQALEHPSTRLIRAASPLIRQKFIEKLQQHYEAHNLSDRLNKLNQIPPEDWTSAHQQEFERCDDQHIKGLLAAEKAAAKVNHYDWSPKFQQATSRQAFWKIFLSLRITQRKPDNKFRIWASSMGLDDIDSISTQLIKRQLRKAQKELREVKMKAKELREEHLKTLIVGADNMDDKKKERQLRILLKVHQRKDQYAKIQRILKPKAGTSMNRIIIPKGCGIQDYPYDPENVTQWETVYEPERIQDYIQVRNINHFGQAHGTPFTVQPLTAIDWAATSPAAQQLITGEIPEELKSENIYANKILEYISKLKQLPTINTQMDSESISKGYKKWRESTTTSPSGAHLGLRRIAAFPSAIEHIERSRREIQDIQANIINIPLRHGFSLQRWRTVINAMLEKIPGMPLLHKLRVIHILEADYNLILKEIFGRRMAYNCEKHECLGDLQDGFRKDRSTITTLLRNELLNNYHERMRINNYVGFTDISACFDRIIPSIIGLLNRKYGCPKEVVKLHADTLKQARYHLRTKNGVSEKSYSHSETTPIYGNGQGAGDSPTQWNIESVMLFDIYKQFHNGAQIISPDQENKLEVPLASFADDTNLFGNDINNELTVDELANAAASSFHTWNNLLHAAGHSLELTKCACNLTIWDFDEQGQASPLAPNEQGQEIKVKDVFGSEKKIKQLHAANSQKILGTLKNPLSLQQDEVLRLQKKSDTFAEKINLLYMTRAEAVVAYQTFYIPALRYSLPITAINQVDLETIQKRATTVFLAAAGYVRSMPREVVFAQKQYQGLGFYHLYDIQGSDGIKLFLKEINNGGSNTQKLLRINLDVIQLEAGIGDPIYENTRPLDYISWSWVTHIRDFLHHIDGKIYGATKRPERYRTNDEYIMDHPHIQSLRQQDRVKFQRCRIFLQVQTLSDISSHDGKHLDKAWLQPYTNKPSQSLLKWPRQGDPGRQAWQIWANTLKRAFLDKYGRLRKPLGRWEKENRSRIWSAYIAPDTFQLFRRVGNKWVNHNLIQEQRRKSIYNYQIASEHDELPHNLTPTRIIHQTRSTIIADPIDRRMLHGKSKTTGPLATTLHTEIHQSQHAYLLEHTKVLMDEAEIAEKTKTKCKFDIASDGSYHKTTKIASFGWVISIDGHLIAKGSGPAPADPEMANPFRAEAFGLASAMAFIQCLIRFTKLSSAQHKWNVYIDNKTLIKRMIRYDERKLSASDNLYPDADITLTAHSLFGDLPLRIEHVTSSQAKQKSQPQQRPWKMELHAMADALAQQHRHLMETPYTQMTNPSYCLLEIQRKFITRDHQKWIMQYAGRIPLQEYYQQKFSWSTKTFESINWTIQQQALKTFGTNDQTRILKFVHEWLPTGKRLHREGQLRLPKCQLCSHLTETSIHLFTCQHKVMEQTRSTALSNIQQQEFMQSGNEQLIGIIAQALQESAKNPQWTPNPQSVPKELARAIKDQSQIGWRGIFHGRLAVSLTIAMESHFRHQKLPDSKYTGQNWGKKLIVHIWKTMLQLWATRSDILHNKTEQQPHDSLKRQYLHQRIIRCYEQAADLPIDDRKVLLQMPKEDMLNKDTRTITAWLATSERVLKHHRHKKRQSKKSNTSKRFEEFFNWKPFKNHDNIVTKKNDLRPP